MAPLLIPLLSAMLYPVGTLLMKRAMEKGVDVPSAVFMTYWSMAAIFMVVFPFESKAIPWELWYQPVIVGVLSFMGQAFALKAISSGDLTIATPALGSKVLMVVLLTEFFLLQRASLSIWIAAGLSFAAVFFLQTGARASRNRRFTTLFLSILAAFCFSLGDVLLQKWAGRWGAFHFVPAFALSGAICSLVLLPFMRKPLLTYPGEVWKGLLGGTGVMGMQTLLITLTIGLFGQATLVNVVFSSRGLWNFVLIWFVGHWFQNHERAAGRRVMGARLIGAGLMFAAIVLVSLK